MKPLSTRKKILELLLNRNSATVSELSGWLKLTKADIRYQLDQLLAEGMIQKLPPPSQHDGRGRPRSSFALRSKNLPPVVSRFLDGVGSLLTNPELDDAAHRIILESMIDSLSRDFHPKSSGASRMNEIVKYLESLGFKAKWEAGASGPKIIIFNNPAAYYLNHPLMRYDGTEKLIHMLMNK